MLVASILALSVAWAEVPVVLPAGEHAEDWEGALALGDLAIGAPAAGPLVELVEGPSWTLRVRDAAGVVREVALAPPTTERAREEAVWLALSLLQASGVPEAVAASTPLPAPAPPEPARAVGVPSIVPAPRPLGPGPALAAEPPMAAQVPLAAELPLAAGLPTAPADRVSLTGLAAAIQVLAPVEPDLAAPAEPGHPPVTGWVSVLAEARNRAGSSPVPGADLRGGVALGPSVRVGVGAGLRGRSDFDVLGPGRGYRGAEGYAGAWWVGRRALAPVLGARLGTARRRFLDGDTEVEAAWVAVGALEPGVVLWLGPDLAAVASATGALDLAGTDLRVGGVEVGSLSRWELCTSVGLRLEFP